ncbi:MAG: hypothetical protein M3305_06290 [Actinomycetota bacterium]|nr:hypothetical protein [Actinomycetota bacterium]
MEFYIYSPGGRDTRPKQFRTKSAELEAARAAAEGQLEATRSLLARLNDIEQSKDALISHYACLLPEALTALSPEEKNQIYAR